MQPFLMEIPLMVPRYAQIDIWICCYSLQGRGSMAIVSHPIELANPFPLQFCWCPHIQYYFRLYDQDTQLIIGQIRILSAWALADVHIVSEGQILHFRYTL